MIKTGNRHCRPNYRGLALEVSNISCIATRRHKMVESQFSKPLLGIKNNFVKEARKYFRTKEASDSQIKMVVKWSNLVGINNFNVNKYLVKVNNSGTFSPPPNHLATTDMSQNETQHTFTVKSIGWISEMKSVNKYMFWFTRLWLANSSEIFPISYEKTGLLWDHY